VLGDAINSPDTTAASSCQPTNTDGERAAGGELAVDGAGPAGGGATADESAEEALTWTTVEPTPADRTVGAGGVDCVPECDDEFLDESL
jgi:hypothetical protein